MLKLILVLQTFIVFNLYNNSFFTEEKNYNIKNILIKHYNDCRFQGKKNQNFLLKELVTFIEENEFFEKIGKYDEVKILTEKEIPPLTKNWKFEKIPFLFDYISPSPKIPRDYYVLPAKIKGKNLKKVLHLKKEIFKFETEYEEPRGSYKFNLQVEYFLFCNDDYLNSGKIENKNLKNVYFNIWYIEDTSPLNTTDREVKVFGELKGID